MWRDIDRTCESIARFSVADAERYQRFCRTWTPFALVMSDLMMTIPTPGLLARTLARSLWSRHGWDARHLPQLRWSIRQFLDATFSSEQVKALLGWLAAQVGISPDQPGGAVYVVWQTMYHVCGIAIPRGGSGMLARALARFIEAHEGSVRLATPVRHIIVEHGQALGVETAAGERIYARRVVSGAHIKSTAQLLGDHVPAAMGKRIGALRASNGGGVLLHIAARGLPVYRASAETLSHTAIQLIAPSLGYVDAAWRAYQAGSRSSQPLLSVITHSASDPTRNPTISIWAQYYPYRFGDGSSWDKYMEALVSDEILETVRQYAPNIRDTILESRLQSPVSFESELGLIRGDLQHIRVTFDQMFMLRPGVRLSAYRTPIKQLYLTGASTHPGGGVTGMPGRNTAKAILGERLDDQGMTDA
jgi:phytoene dehydrogenase-like protein